MEKSNKQPLTASLPAPYTWDGRSLKYDGNAISNCIPVIKAVKSYVQRDENETYVSIGAILGNGEKTSRKTIPLRGLDMLDIQADIDSRCCEYPGRQSRQLLLKLIRYFVSRQDATTVYQADTLGFLHYNNRVAFNAGSKIIGDLGVEVEVRTKGYNFNPPAGVSNEQLAAYVRNIIQLNRSVTAPIFAYFILGILRDLFREAGVPIHFCMYLVGEQQSMKTTLATYLCSMYDRHIDVERHLHNLTATEIKLHEVLNMEKDMVAIIDDLNLDDSKRKEREQEAKISGLIRAAANGVGRETMRDQKSINAQPLFCGEYLLKNTSTNNRLLIVHLKQGQINKEKLLEIQNDANLLTAFAEQFISWILDNYKSQCGFIASQYSAFLELRSGGIFYQERLNRSAAVLAIAYGVFLKFCKVKGWDVGMSNTDFRVDMENLLERQIEDLNLQRKAEPDYVVELFQLLRYELDSGLVRDGRPKGNIWKAPIYRIKGPNYVCIFILSEKMGEMSQEISKKFGIAVSIHRMLDALDHEGIVIKDNTKNGTRSRKKGGQRCYVLNYSRWVDYMQEIAREFENGCDY